MYEYGGGLDDSLRQNFVQLTKEDIVAMSTLLVNGKYEDCSELIRANKCAVQTLRAVTRHGAFSCWRCILAMKPGLVPILELTR